MNFKDTLDGDLRHQAERTLFWAYKAWRRAHDAYDGSDYSRARLRDAELRLENAELVAHAVLVLGASNDATS